MAENINNFFIEVNENTQELLNEAGSPIQAFTKYVIEEISEKTNLGEAEECYAVCRTADGRVIGEINGYAKSFNGETVSFFYTIYNSSDPLNPEIIKAEQYKQAVARLQGFYQWAVSGHHQQIEPSARHYQICKYIYDNEESICNVKLYVISNGIINPNLKEPKQRIRNKHLEFPTWDINKLYINSNSTSDHESIDIDLVKDEEFRFSIPCIHRYYTEDNYQCILALLPGQFLYNLYENFNTNLLQNNVRFFLGFKGKKSINKEILRTLREKPQRFLAYNNGITATAQEIQLDESNNIVNIQDLQILNGGQTTASIFYSKSLEKSDKPETYIDLSKVFVQMKLIVLKDNVRDFLSDITLYSNSQNKVKTADYSTNNEFNLKIQDLSRTHYAPDTYKNGNLTQWYYERVRGQYDADLKNCANFNAKEYFTRIHPVNQKFKKELLAKVWNAWNQYPYFVTVGDQGNYTKFIKNIEEQKYVPDEIYYENTIALIIMYLYMQKESETFKNFHQIKAQVIAYTFSTLNYISGCQFSLYQIWKSQSVHPDLKNLIDSLAQQLCDKMLRDCPQNVTFRDFCKSDKTWEAVKKYVYTIDYSLLQSFYKDPKEDEERAGASTSNVSNEDHKLIMKQGSKFWSGLSQFENENFTDIEKETAIDITSCLMNDRILTDKQVILGKRLIEKVQGLGLDIDEIRNKSQLITDKTENNTLDLYNRINRISSEDWDAIKILANRVCTEQQAKAIIKVVNAKDKKKIKPALLQVACEALDVLNKKFNKNF